MSILCWGCFGSNAILQFSVKPILLLMCVCGGGGGEGALTVRQHYSSVFNGYCCCCCVCGVEVLWHLGNFTFQC